MVAHPSILNGDIARCPFQRAFRKEEELETKRSAARGMLGVGSAARAAELLASLAPSDPSGKADALLGDAYFMLERYDDAERSYRAALNKDPSNAGWKDRVAHAVGNVYSEITTENPSRAEFEARFERDRILAGPDLPEIEAEIRKIAERKGLAWLLHKIKTGIGSAAGAAGSGLFHALGKLAGATGTSDEIWTNWYKDSSLPLPEKLKDMFKLLKLAHMRDELFKNNMVSTYPAGAKTGFYSGNAAPPDWVKYWRTPDGSWNYLAKEADGRHDPMVGAAFTRFFRNVGDDKGLESTRPKPSPATNPVNVMDVSEVLLKREGPMKEVPFLNMLAANWIQFMVHDWVSHGENDRTVLDKIPIPRNHPARKKYHLDAMPIERTSPDPTRMREDGDQPPTYLNEVTHWWDGSQIYGSEKHTQKKLRSGAGGKLRLTDDGRLPVDPMTKTEMTGFARNWWVGLSMMHTLFAREHNAICDKLKASHPSWNDEKLFQTARLINAAVMAKIHTVEWTPAILPNRVLNDAMNTNWYGLLTRLFNKKTHRKAIEEIRIKSPELGGIIGGVKGTFAKYALSEEFTAVYRLHSLLPDSMKIMRHDGAAEPVDMPLVQMRQAASSKISDRVPMADLFFSFGKQHPGQLVANNFPESLRELSLPGSPFVDLGAIDVYRDRERGVPPYNQLRKELGLKPIRRFDDITDDRDVVQKLRKVYGTDEQGNDRVDDIDLLIGTLCEGHRPTGYGFGETLFQVFILNASWRLLGDRFFTDDYREEVYTKEGLDWIDEATMKSVLLRHFPELVDTGLSNVKNAFEPWDEGELDPERHPLEHGGHPIHAPKAANAGRRS